MHPFLYIFSTFYHASGGPPLHPTAAVPGNLQSTLSDVAELLRPGDLQRIRGSLRRLQIRILREILSPGYELQLSSTFWQLKPPFLVQIRTFQGPWRSSESADRCADCRIGISTLEIGGGVDVGRSDANLSF